MTSQSRQPGLKKKVMHSYAIQDPLQLLSDMTTPLYRVALCTEVKVQSTPDLCSKAEFKVHTLYILGKTELKAYTHLVQLLVVE